jgi:hypothetical protein
MKISPHFSFPFHHFPAILTRALVTLQRAVAQILRRQQVFHEKSLGH